MESDFTTLACSAAEHLLCPLAERWHVVYHLPGNIKFPFLQELPQSLAMVSSFHLTLHFITLTMCLRWQVELCGKLLWHGFRACQSPFTPEFSCWFNCC